MPSETRTCSTNANSPKPHSAISWTASRHSGIANSTDAVSLEFRAVLWSSKTVGSPILPCGTAIG